MKPKHTLDDAALSTLESRLSALMGSGPELPAAARKRIWHKTRALTPAPHPMRRLPKAIFYPAFAMLMIIGFLSGYGSVVVAASASIPGDLLYPIERQAETVWVTFTPDAQRCQVTAVLLQRRIHEIKALMEAGKFVPDSSLQEVEMLFLSIAEEPLCQDQTPDLLSQLTNYRQQIGKLVERYPYSAGLNRVFEAANTAIVALGGESLEAPLTKLSVLFN